MNAIVKQDSRLPALQMEEAELLDVLQSSLYPGASHQSIKMVLGYCKAAGLDPMRKPVHIVPMWDNKAKQMRDVTMPGIGLYRTDAARTGEHVGTDEPIFGPMVEYDLSGTKVTVPEWCKVTVYRMVGTLKCAYTATEYWVENYATAGKDTAAPNTMWKKRGRGQLAKCAEAQALRKGFPEVGNQPTADEMEGKTLDMGPADVVQPPAAPPALQPYPDDQFKANLPKWREVIESARKTPDDLIQFAQSRSPTTLFTEEQKATLRGFKAVKNAAATDVQPKGEATAPPDKATAASDEAPAVTFAVVNDKLNAAKDMDALNVAADLIAQVPDTQQQAELNAAYEARIEELSGN